MSLRHECAGASRKAPNTPEDIICPHCGAEVEMWTHDEEVNCPSCSKTITRDQLK